MSGRAYSGWMRPGRYTAVRCCMLDERLCYTLVCCRTGRLLDANSNFFTITGCTPSNILQRVLDPIVATEGHAGTPLSDIPLVRGKRPPLQH